MHIVATVGPDNTTKAVLPFTAAKGAVANGETVDFFLMQEATYVGTRQIDLNELKSPGLPTVQAVLDEIRPHINSLIVCQPCAEARGITEDGLLDIAEFGNTPDLAKQAAQHGTTVTF